MVGDKWWFALVACGVLLAACDAGTEQELVFVQRSGCLACHMPLMPDGTAVGIEAAHPPVDGQPLACVSCHGGDPEARKQSLAHVQPIPGAPRRLEQLTTGELDDVSRDYLRFINPGDFRVAGQSCGAGSDAAQGSGCHQEILDAVQLTPMATSAGLLASPRLRAGSQRTGAGVFGVRDARDDGFRLGEVPGAVSALDKLSATRVNNGELEIGPYQDLMLGKECVNCHLWSFGPNDFAGNYRSSGCSACHMVYDDSGLSQSADPTGDMAKLPRPIRHELTTAIPTQQCTHCHYRGARIGLSFQGYRDSGAEGTDPSGVGVLGEALHGNEANHYVVDEDLSNTVDETPPDVHFEAGMHCIDCHLGPELHGDGEIFTHTANATTIECEDCHGDEDEEGDGVTERGQVLPHVSRDEDGSVWLTGRVTGQRHPISQVKRLLEERGPSSSMHRAMARNEEGFSHLDSLECYTCHSGWVPTCYGCHATVDMSQPQANQIDGLTSPGAISFEPGEVDVNTLILMLNTEGKVSPSMPAARMFFTAVDGTGEALLTRKVRTGPGGQPGMGHRAVAPHTVVSRSPWMACQTCHPVEGTGANMERLMQVIGAGSSDHLVEDGDGQVWALDQVLDPETREPTVLVGHDAPEVSRPLTPEIIERMLSVEVPAQ